jgi:hypothetical protein
MSFIDVLCVNIGDVENAYHELQEQLINQISVYLD